MNEREWAELSAMLDAWWPATDFTPDMEALWLKELGTVDAPDVERAIRELLREGSAFAPSLAQVLKHVEDRQFETLGIAAVLEQWRKAASATLGDPIRALARLRARGEEETADFAEFYGPRALLNEPVDDPAHGSLVRRQITDRYREFQQQRRKSFNVAGADRQVAAGERRGGLRPVDFPALREAGS